MSAQSLEIHPNTYAKIAGLLYLIIAVSGAFSIGYVPSVIYVDGDAAATMQAFMDNNALYRLGILGDTIVLLTEIILTVMLFILFKPVSPTLSMIAAWARLSMVMVMAINLLINILPLILLAEPGFGRSQWQDLTMILFKAHEYGVYIWGILFGLHLLALGYLVIRSGFFPRALGWMMLIGSFGYIIEGVARITASNSSILSWLFVALLTLVTIGELSFALWLLIKGINLTAWQSRHVT